MTIGINYTYPETFLGRRNRTYTRDVNTDDKIKAAIGSAAGTLYPMAYMAKKQGIKNIFKLKYGLPEMVLISAASIVGGVAAGMINESEQAQKNKLKEGVFMFMNASVPAWVVAGALKLSESSRSFNSIPGKILSMAGGLLVGMYGAAALSNLICDPKDRHPDRKLTLKDCVANIDDAIGVLVLAKFPFASKLHIERLLPAIYAYCGYRAGKSN